MKLARPTPKQATVAAIAGVATLALPLVFSPEHHFAWDAIPGFYAIYGAAGCGALVLSAKWLGRVLLVKPPGWYGGDDARTGDPS